MSKENDVADLLGTDEPKAKKAAAKKSTKAEAKPAAKKAAAPKAEAKPAAKAEAKPAAKAAPAKKAVKAEPKAKTAKEPITFEEGERDALYKRIKQLVKKPINSRDLATKLDIPTRKLRPVLYSLQGQGVVSLELGSSKVAGMTVSPA